MRPLLFLDVDGVINAFRPRSDDWGDWKIAHLSDDVDTYKVKYSPTMIKRIGALEADIVWCTTWTRHANSELVKITEWPVLPVIEIPAHETATDAARWKQEGVQDYILDHRNRPFVWIDDDVCRQRWVQTWANNVGWSNKIVAPSAARGLTEEELTSVENFINDCQRKYRYS